ncbi:MAG TPA: cysteine peptidase family C39 domain-containing protein [Dongiaceae bacterium]|nr:cysteine peptidase family C39 domain-containing protein [Dongiaceae bacterium]
MNVLLFPTLLLAAALFWLGHRLAHRQSPWLIGAAILAALPAIVFAAFYTGVFGEARWLYVFRALPGTELSAAGIGLLMGWLQYQRASHPGLRRQVSAFFIPFLMVLCVAAPYLKQILLRPDWSKFQDRWDNQVCLQSSESSCGPAAAATLLRLYGKPATELELAREAHTTRRGTENWYLSRALCRHGLPVNCVITALGAQNVHVPAIAGVRLPQAANNGHFIALLAQNGDKFVVGDPLQGREELTRAELAERYAFTGFYLVPARLQTKN